MANEGVAMNSVYLLALLILYNNVIHQKGDVVGIIYVVYNVRTDNYSDRYTARQLCEYTCKLYAKSSFDLSSESIWISSHDLHQYQVVRIIPPIPIHYWCYISAIVGTKFIPECTFYLSQEVQGQGPFSIYGWRKH